MIACKKKLLLLAFLMGPFMGACSRERAQNVQEYSTEEKESQQTQRNLSKAKNAKEEITPVSVEQAFGIIDVAPPVYCSPLTSQPS